MRISRFFVPDLLSVGEVISLRDATSHYATNVLRLKIGASVILFNGQGGEYHATVLNSSKKGMDLTIDEFDPVNRESVLQSQLAIGLSKGDRMDWVIQKATELGVANITPLTTERTEVKLKGERLDKKQQHWQQVSISACEQSQRNRVPIIHPPQTLNDYLLHCDANKKFILHSGGDSEELSSVSDNPLNVAIMVGPEGGFSDAEVEAADSSGFKVLTLGPRVLRTETAPIVALSLIQHLWGDY